MTGRGGTDTALAAARGAAPGLVAIDDLEEGSRATCLARITSEDIAALASLTGDDNPIHCDEALARQLGFSRPVAHGLLALGLISRLIGTRLPGPGSVWFGQETEFLAPVRAGDEVEASVTVTHVSRATGVVVLATEVRRLPDTPVLRGRAKVRVPRFIPQARRSMRLSEMVAIVTGGSKGLGAVIARTLARSEIRVVINYAHDEKAAEQIASAILAAGGKAIAIRADVADPGEVRRLFEAGVGAFGKVDVVVNNATPPIRPKPLLETTKDDLDRYLDVYVKGTLELARLAVPGMRERKFGRIVNVLTSYLSEVPPNLGAYVTAKSALYGLSRAMAVEFGPWGITVNMVSPSMLIGDQADDLGLAAREAVAGRTPLRRLGEPEEVANLVLFLLGEGSTFISGANIPVTGGILV